MAQLSNHKKENKELTTKLKQTTDSFTAADKQVSTLSAQLTVKHEELEQRLETISKLIQKNDQLSQHLRLHKSRLEKFKTDELAKYLKELSDKSSEIEVLKEMVKGNQLQLRSKEKEALTLKQKLQRVEGTQLAMMQQQNAVMK